MKQLIISVYVFLVTQIIFINAALADGRLENLLEGAGDYLSTKIIPAGGALGVTLGGGIAALGGKTGHEIARNAVVGTGIGTVGATLIYTFVKLAD